MAAAGAADGEYTLGSLSVVVRGGEARLASTGVIAGVDRDLGVVAAVRVLGGRRAAARRAGGGHRHTGRDARPRRTSACSRPGPGPTWSSCPTTSRCAGSCAEEPGCPYLDRVTPDVVVVDHHDSYTWNLVHLVASVTGVLPTVVQHDEVEPDEVLRHSHVVLSPGPGTPVAHADFAVGREVLLAGSRPVLGVCLGMQGMVTTYGGTVDRIAPAHGVVERIRHDGDGVFDGLPQLFAAVRYHSLAALSLPDELVVTASDAGGDVVMGVRHVALPQEGVQFHPESILSEHGAEMVANFLGRRRECGRGVPRGGRGAPALLLARRRRRPRVVRPPVADRHPGAGRRLPDLLRRHPRGDPARRRRVRGRRDRRVRGAGGRARQRVPPRPVVRLLRLRLPPRPAGAGRHRATYRTRSGCGPATCGSSTTTCGAGIPGHPAEPPSAERQCHRVPGETAARVVRRGLRPGPGAPARRQQLRGQPHLPARRGERARPGGGVPAAARAQPRAVRRVPAARRRGRARAGCSARRRSGTRWSRGTRTATARSRPSRSRAPPRAARRPGRTRSCGASSRPSRGSAPRT